MKLIRKAFSKKEEKEVKLGKSVRGVGRVLADDAKYGIGTGIALGAGKKAADKAAKEGKSEAEVIDEAGKKAKKTARAIQMGKAAVVAGVAGAGVKKATEKVIKENKKSILKGAAKALVKGGEENPESKKAIRKAVTKIVKNPGKAGAAVAGVLGAGILAHGAAKAFRRGRLAENAAHKNTIERIKDGKKEEKNYSVIQPQDIKLYSKSEKSEKKEEKKESKLKFGDRLRSAEYKLYRKGGNMEKLERERLNNTKKWKKGTIVGSALGGAALGAANEIVMENATGGLYRGNPTKAALLNGAVAAGGAGLGLAARKVLEKKSPKYKKGWDKQKDLLDYRMGKLSKEDYIKRWGGTINGKEVEGSKNKEDK